MANIREIALRAGVSIASVSRALHNDSKIRPELRDKILKIANDLNYNIDALAHMANIHRSRTIGIILFDYENPWYMLLIQQIERLLRIDGYAVMLVFDDGAPDSFSDCFRRLMDAGAVSILFNSHGALTEQNSNAARQRGIRLYQFISSDRLGLPRFCIDDDYGVEIALRYLLAQGYRKLLYITPGGASIQSVSGILQEYGILPENYTTMDSSHREYLADDIRKIILEKNPDVILVRADHAARAVVQALRDLRLSWPEGIGLVVFDDLPWVSMMNITSIAHPIEILSEMIVRSLLHGIHNREAPEIIPPPVKPFLIERGSAIKPRKVTHMKIPYIAGDYIHVYQPQPDVYHGENTTFFRNGERYDNWICNDFSVIHSGTDWHMIGITHPAPPWFTSLQADMENQKYDVHEAEWQLFHAVSNHATLKESLVPGGFHQAPQILPSPERPNERHEIWAPICWSRGQQYYLIYAPNPMRLAISDDLYNWNLQGPVFFSEMDSSRDPNIMEKDGIYTLVYIMGNSLYVRESTDLRHFSEPRVLIARNDNASMESPILKYIDGWYYLMYCIYDPNDRVNGSYDYRTYVHAARTLDGLSIDSPITNLRAHAPEIFQDEDGDWYIASAEWPNRGVSIAPLKWHEV